MLATWLDTNSWLLEMGGKRLLVDPWLVGPLVFGNQGWLFKGVRPHPMAMPENIDLIVLSQGLEDHAHPATLEALDKSIPVVGSENAAQVAEKLGFHQVTALSHGERHVFADSIEVQAVPGAPIGPTVLENGYILREQATGLSLFYEPHGFHAESLKQAGPVDVVITPVLDIMLPLVGPVLRGQQGAMELVEWLQPQVVLPTAGAGEVEYQGLLVSILKTAGGPQQLQGELQAKGISTRVLEPQVGVTLELPLSEPSASSATAA